MDLFCGDSILTDGVLFVFKNIKAVEILLVVKFQRLSFFVRAGFCPSLFFADNQVIAPHPPRIYLSFERPYPLVELTLDLSDFSSLVLQ